jgi:hypothetical protein
VKRIALLLILFIPFSVNGGESKIGGRTSPDGKEEIMLDLPGSEHMKNAGGMGPRGPGSGSGLCVFTSIEMAGRWANEEALRGLQQKMTHEEGGGWPSKVDAILAKYAPDVRYVQYSGTDPSILKLALKTGRMPGVTYGYSPRYGSRISHMVNLVHFSDKWAAVLDNNFPGEDQYEWMRPDEFLYRWKLGDTKGWAVIPLAPPPPPIPLNRDAAPPKGERVIGQGWGRVPSAPVGVPTSPTVSAASCEWRFFKDDDSQVALLKDGVQLGNYSFDGCYFRRYDARTNTWGKQTTPPVPPPPDRRAKPLFAPPEQDFGVAKDRIPNGETYSVNGRKVPPQLAHKAVTAGGTLTDDSGKWHLTVVGTKEECQQVLDDLKGHAALAPWKDRLLIQSYRPDAWAIKGVGLPNGGRPTVIVQAPPGPDGKGQVLHAQNDYDGGAEALAGALRRADPAYDPSKDPDLRKRPAPTPLPAPAPTPVPAPVPVPEPSPPKIGCPDWASHTTASLLTAIAMTVVYLLTQSKKGKQ